MTTQKLRNHRVRHTHFQKQKQNKTYNRYRWQRVSSLKHNEEFL